MGRFNKKTDANQKEIVDTFQSLGAIVYDASAVGGGFPDLVVGYNGRNFLVEVKMPGKHLNKLQKTWHDTWLGTVHIVTTPQEAAALLDGADDTLINMQNT